MQKILNTLFLVLFTFITLLGQTGKAKYVFLFIGDGMGINQVRLTEAVFPDSLNMRKMPNLGLMTTNAANRYITCSAAAGTAIACGQKTSIGTIGLDVNKQQRLKSIAEKVKENGRKVGIVTTVSLDHATPAAFYAHRADREMHDSIAIDLINSNFDYFGGGGFLKFELNENNRTFIKNKGYNLIDSRLNFLLLDSLAGKTIVISPILDIEKAINFSIDQTNEEITLPQLTDKGIEVLNNDSGFFMMIEGGKIDWACHSNDAGSLIREVYSFDRAIGVAYQFYKKHPNETLIIVLADHETGGLSLGVNSRKYDSDFSLLRKQKVSIVEFTKKMDSLKKTSNNAEQMYLEAMNMVKLNFGLGEIQIPLNKNDKKNFQKAFQKSLLNKPIKAEYSEDNPVASLAVKILAEKAGVGWTTSHHTGTPVAVYSIGVGASQFSGFFDNTNVSTRILDIMGFR